MVFVSFFLLLCQHSYVYQQLKVYCKRTDKCGQDINRLDAAFVYHHWFVFYNTDLFSKITNAKMMLSIPCVSAVLYHQSVVNVTYREFAEPFSMTTLFERLLNACTTASDEELLVAFRIKSVEHCAHPISIFKLVHELTDRFKLCSSVISSLFDRNVPFGPAFELREANRWQYSFDQMLAFYTAYDRLLRVNYVVEHDQLGRFPSTRSLEYPGMFTMHKPLVNETALYHQRWDVLLTGDDNVPLPSVLKMKLLTYAANDHSTNNTSEQLLTNLRLRLAFTIIHNNTPVESTFINVRRAILSAVHYYIDASTLSWYWSDVLRYLKAQLPCQRFLKSTFVEFVVNQCYHTSSSEYKTLIDIYLVRRDFRSVFEIFLHHFNTSASQNDDIVVQFYDQLLKLIECGALLRLGRFGCTEYLLELESIIARAHAYLKYVLGDHAVVLPVPLITLPDANVFNLSHFIEYLMCFEHLPKIIMHADQTFSLCDIQEMLRANYCLCNYRLAYVNVSRINNYMYGVTNLCKIRNHELKLAHQKRKLTIFLVCSDNKKQRTMMTFFCCYC